MITLTRRCIECGKEYKFDPADGLPRYCEDCYYELGLGDGPDVSFTSEEQREMSTENWQGKDHGCDPGPPGQPGPPGLHNEVFETKDYDELL